MKAREGKQEKKGIGGQSLALGSSPAEMGSFQYFLKMFVLMS